MQMTYKILADGKAHYQMSGTVEDMLTAAMNLIAIQYGRLKRANDPYMEQYRAAVLAILNDPASVVWGGKNAPEPPTYVQ